MDDSRSPVFKLVSSRPLSVADESSSLTRLRHHPTELLEGRLQELRRRLWVLEQRFPTRTQRAILRLAA
jgi:hypothetical protein